MSLLQSLNKLSEIQAYCSIRAITLILFSTEDCQPCKILKPIITNVSGMYPEDVGFLYVTLSDDNQDVASSYNINGVPTIGIFKGNTPVDFKSGFTTEADVIDWLSSRVRL